MGILVLSLLVIFIIVVFTSRDYSRTIGDYRTVGQIGEGIVSRVLQRLPAEDYLILNDITIKNRSGTSQIDHLVISPFGIFVIETKCYKGWLLGSEEGEKWTQALYTEKHQFYNPIQQNRGHIRALKYNLDDQYPHIPYYPIIVLAGHCQFKSFEQVRTPVVYPGGLRATILNMSTQKFLAGSQVADIRETLQNISIKGEEYRQLHIQNVRDKTAIAENEIKEGKCPRCGGDLVERQGKYGRFLGCSGYPNCKFTEKL